MRDRTNKYEEYVHEWTSAKLVTYLVNAGETIAALRAIVVSATKDRKAAEAEVEAGLRTRLDLNAQLNAALVEVERLQQETGYLREEMAEAQRGRDSWTIAWQEKESEAELMRQVVKAAEHFYAWRDETVVVDAINNHRRLTGITPSLPPREHYAASSESESGDE